MSYKPTAQEVKTLRASTGAGPMDCKKALVEAAGNYEKATEIIRAATGRRAEKLSDRETSEGLVGQYIHANGKVGVLVQVECNTDFVAGNDIFKEFVSDLAIHIAGSPSTLYVSDSEIPTEVLEKEKAFHLNQVDQSKPEAIQARIIEGKLSKWKQEIVLLDQTHINVDKHDNKTIEQIRAEASTRTGENIEIKRFARFVIG